MNTGYELICAVRDGKLQRVKQIVDTVGLFYAKEWAEGYVLLVEAIKNGNIEITKLLLLNHAKVNSKQTTLYNKHTNTPLHYAVRCGNVEIVKMLLDRNAVINARDKRRRTPLYDAVETNRVEFVALLLNHGAYIDVRDDEDKTPLHVAAINNCFEIVEILLKHRADINSKVQAGIFYKGYTPLHYAVLRGSPEMVKLLIKSNCDVVTKASNEITPLHIAAENGNLQIAQDLLNHGAYINSQIKTTGKDRYTLGYTPLHYAVLRGSPEMVKLLIKSNCDVVTKASNEITPLHIAAENGNLQIAQDLLNHGAYINSQIKTTGKDRYTLGYTPLHYAVQKNNQEIVTLLLKNNCDVDTKASNEITPLHIAAEKGNLQIAQDLLNHGAYINCQINCVTTSTDKDGYTPLHLACARGSAEVVKLLLSKGANVNANAKGVMPLSVAMQKGHEMTAKSLLEHGANVDAQDKDGNSVLYLAVERRHLKLVKHILNFCPDVSNRSNRCSLYTAVQTPGFEEVVESLLKYGFTVTSEHINNCTLMFDSVEKGYLKIVEDLLQNGADINMISKRNFIKGDTDTLLHSAVKKKQEDIVKLLINYKADVNAKNANGRTPIFYALGGLDLKCVKLLLNNGANIKNIPFALLHHAVVKECIEIVDIILQHDSEIAVNACDRNAQTALHFASRAEIAKLLLSKGAKINICSRNGTTPLHAAVNKGYEKVVEIFLEYNANVNSVDKCGTMPIHTSAKIGNIAIMKMLINKVADINAKDKDDNSALHIATEYNHEELVEILLKCGADYDSRNKKTKLPLHIAAEKGFLKIVLNILKFGANINTTDVLGKTALHFACEKGHDAIVTVLLENGADINIMHIARSSLLDSLFEDDDDDDYDVDYHVRFDAYGNDHYDSDSSDYHMYGGEIESPLFFDDSYNYVYGNISRKYNNHDEDEKHHGQIEIANILVQHIVILKAQNLFVDEAYSQSIGNSRDLADFYTSCENEVIEMRSEKIGNTNVTFYDILTKDIGQLAIYARNEGVVHILQSQVYQKMFPSFANMLHNRFSKGQERQRLINSSARCFNLLIGYELPDLFINQMFRYLSVMDLENLIEAYPNYNNISDDYDDQQDI